MRIQHCEPVERIPHVSIPSHCNQMLPRNQLNPTTSALKPGEIVQGTSTSELAPIRQILPRRYQNNSAVPLTSPQSKTLELVPLALEQADSATTTSLHNCGQVVHDRHHHQLASPVNSVRLTSQQLQRNQSVELGVPQLTHHHQTHSASQAFDPTLEILDSEKGEAEEDEVATEVYFIEGDQLLFVVKS